MSAKPEAADAAPPPAKSKKMLIIIVAAVLVLVLGGGGAFFFMSKQKAAAEEGGEEAAPPPPKAAVAHVDPKTPPVYLPMDPMVVNLSDPGGERVAQIGITLEVIDAKASDTVKAYLPTIRSSVLMLISQRTADELLKSEGKEKLVEDILKAASVPFGGSMDEEEESTSKKKRKRAVQVQYPVTGVLFSSFIVQ
ncbi:MAG: flagellar basal body-associated FliL family protein [Rhodoferax sp.]|uniref:flagellar basal body-associated FliL family protein n=1 Tax=Rhodoferax sp. TaxID=50421 RepID=UPI002ACD51BA|nr:flagellar basal body-associated FliL family protein [Rhodoferax sp.]MDZ7890136.1 flagellar basal body-associated FliL family protein [Rhodoferax sp.]